MSAVLVTTSICHAEIGHTATDSDRLPADYEVREILALENAVRGYVSVVFASGYARACGLKVVKTEKVKSDQNRSWFEIFMEWQCRDQAREKLRISFHCAERSDLVCTPLEVLP